MTPQTEISPENKEKFIKIINDNKDSFAISAEQLGKCKGVEFEI